MYLLQRIQPQLTRQGALALHRTLIAFFRADFESKYNPTASKNFIIRRKAIMS